MSKYLFVNVNSFCTFCQPPFENLLIFNNFSWRRWGLQICQPLEPKYSKSGMCYIVSENHELFHHFLYVCINPKMLCSVSFYQYAPVHFRKEGSVYFHKVDIDSNLCSYNRQRAHQLILQVILFITNGVMNTVQNHLFCLC